MVKDVSSRQTTVIASYWTRRDAEIARDHLEEAGISAFVRADDAGGMHPELQWSQGVRLVVLGSAARHALEALQEANLLPRSQEDVGSETGDPVEEATAWSRIRALLWVFAVLAAFQGWVSCFVRTQAAKASIASTTASKRMEWNRSNTCCAPGSSA